MTQKKMVFELNNWRTDIIWAENQRGAISQPKKFYAMKVWDHDSLPMKYGFHKKVHGGTEKLKPQRNVMDPEKPFMSC